MNKHFDFAILGAGLAGVSLAYELSKSGASICLIDHKGIARGASGTPIGLVNPATGRYATKTWEAEHCYESILQNMVLVQQSTPVQFFKKSGVLRPALDQKIADRMKENATNPGWPKGWIEWMDEEALKELNPGVRCVGGGVWLPIGITVDIPTYLKAFTDHLENEGIEVYTGSSSRLQKSSNGWSISFPDYELLANSVVVTAGIYSKDIPFFNHLPLYPVKGQLALLESEEPLPFEHAVSALGYTGSLSSHQFVVGSTYEHTFDHEGVDQKGLDYLLSRFGKVLPELKKNSRVIAQFSGIRASTPNRKPIMGEHSDEENLNIFAGLGSKGLLYSGYLSKIMAEFLLNQTPLPDEVSIERIKK